MAYVSLDALIKRAKAGDILAKSALRAHTRMVRSNPPYRIATICKDGNYTTILVPR